MIDRVQIVGASIRGALALLALAVLYAISTYDYLIFHTLAEGFSIIVACTIFLIAWNSRRFLDNNYLLFLGIAYLYVAGFDLLHTFAYKGMDLIPRSDGNLPTQLWIIARYVQSISLLIAPFFIGRGLPVGAVFGVFSAASLLVLGSLFYVPVFPTCFVDGVGLTWFKVVSEYVICLILLGAIYHLIRRRDDFDRAVLIYLICSVIFFMASELAFTSYVSVYGPSNFIGHYLKIISFYLLYKAIVERGLTRPYDLLFRDLNKKKQELEDERNFVSAVLNTAGSLVVVLDIEGRIIRFNRACEQMTGYTFDEVNGIPFWDLFLIPEEIEPVRAVFSKLVAAEFPNEHENYWVAKDGKRYLISWANTALVDENGRVKFVIKTGTDITEHRRAAQEILRAKEEWETTFDAVPDLIMILDRDHRILRANRSVAERFGGRPEDLAGKPCYSVVHETKCPATCCPHAKLMKDGVEHTEELYEGKISGVFSVTCSPLWDRAGRLMGSVHVARDITDRKRAEEALRQTLRELEQSNAELQQFAYVASHDLQEPLRMVSSYVKLLERRYKGNLDGDADEFIGYAVDGAKRMHSLINDLLDYSRVGTHGKPLEPVDCEVPLDQALVNLRMAIADSRAAVTHDPLPTVMGDGMQLVQLFQNLVDNALKFRGGESPLVHISAHPNGDHWLFSVCDNGIGIAAEYADRIFTIFQRLHRREEYPGTGIGLAICRKIVERHGGRIWVEPGEEAGTTFFFTLHDERGS